MVQLLDVFFCRETKEMMAAQAKVSVDTAKEVQGDASLKTKADKDRRLREKNQANTKKFLDERKNNAIKQNKKKEKQKKLQQTQLDDISKYIKDVSEYYCCCYCHDNAFLRFPEHHYLHQRGAPHEAYQQGRELRINSIPNNFKEISHSRNLLH